jgi:hypothetical protein
MVFAGASDSGWLAAGGVFAAADAPVAYGLRIVCGCGTYVGAGGSAKEGEEGAPDIG